MSTLGDLIVMRGPYATGDVMPFPTAPNGHLIISATEINALRDELIALRHIAKASVWPSCPVVDGPCPGDDRGMICSQPCQDEPIVITPKLHHQAEHPGSDFLGYGRCTGCGEMWPCMASRGERP